jgi:hypothetical protein
MCWIVLFLDSCASYVAGPSDVAAILRLSSSDKTLEQRLDPRFSYLRIGVGKRFTFLVLGYTEPRRHDAPVQVWFGAGGEVMRLQNGRIVGTVGMPVEWSNVRLSANLDWSDRQGSDSYSRARDVMPGYDYGIVDTVSRVAIAPPKRSMLANVPASSLSWFEERSVGIRHLPLARYGVAYVEGRAIVMYGEQCLSESFCLSWQRWATPTDGQNYAK